LRNTHVKLIITDDSVAGSVVEKLEQNRQRLATTFDDLLRWATIFDVIALVNIDILISPQMQPQTHTIEAVLRKTSSVLGVQKSNNKAEKFKLEIINLNADKNAQKPT